MKAVIEVLDQRVWGVVRNMPDVEFVVVSGSWDGVERLDNVTLADGAPEGAASIDPSLWGDDPAGWMDAAAAQMKGATGGRKGGADKRRGGAVVEVAGDARDRHQAG